MNQIIINADDFGINDAVTSEIERLIDAGRLTSTTIMANGRCLDEVRRFSAQHPEVSFGVHLCLSEFSSVTRSSVLQKYDITDKNGEFIYKAIFKQKTMTPDLREAIKDELNAQVDIINDIGVKISHADSHHHVHTLPLLNDIIVDVLHERGIRRIRLASDYLTLRKKIHLFKWLQRERLNMRLKKGFQTTDYFMSLSDGFDKIKSYSGHTIELMCHPGHPGDQYKREICLLETEFDSLIMNNHLIF